MTLKDVQKAARKKGLKVWIGDASGYVYLHEPEGAELAGFSPEPNRQAAYRRCLAVINAEPGGAP